MPNDFTEFKDIVQTRIMSVIVVCADFFFCSYYVSFNYVFEQASENIINKRLLILNNSGGYDDLHVTRFKQQQQQS